MAWYSGITNAVKSAASTLKTNLSAIGSGIKTNIVQPVVSQAKANWADPLRAKNSLSVPASTLYSNVAPAVKSVVNTISSGAAKSSPYYTAGTSDPDSFLITGGDSVFTPKKLNPSPIPAPNLLNTGTQQYRLFSPTPLTGGFTDTAQPSYGYSPEGGSATIVGGQGLLPGSVGSVSRGGFGTSGQPFGTSNFGLKNTTTEKKQKQGMTLDQWNSAFMGGLNYNGFGPKVPAYTPSGQIKSNVIQATDIMKSQGADTFVDPNLDVGTFQSQVSTQTNDFYNRNTGINPPTDSFIAAPDNMAGSSANVGGLEGAVSAVEEGGAIKVTYQDGSFTYMRPEEFAAKNQPPIDETMQSPEVPGSQFNLQAEYNRLQQESGITEAIKEWKDLQNQAIAIETALKANRDSIMEDPDFSLATKEGRVNYLFNNSMEARTYEALTKRMEALGGFIDKQNESIKTQLGFANQDFQNQLAYDEANKPSGSEYSLQEIGGQGYVFNKSTGQFSPIGGSGATSKSEQDVLKALNSSDAWKNYQTAKNYTSVMLDTMSRFDANKDGQLDRNDWNMFANDDPGIRQFVTAMVRVQDPVSSRLADGGDAVAGNSLADKLELELKRFAVGANATPSNLESAWNNAVATLNGTWAPAGLAAEQQIRGAYGSSNPLGLTPPSGSSGSDWNW